MDRNNQVIQRGRPVSGMDAAHANEYFEQFVNASTLKHILGYYRGIIDNLHLKPNVFSQFYPKLRANLTSWRAKALWKKFDARASHKCYNKGKLAGNTRVLIIGGGPCGLRTAIEAQLLGAKVVVVEKRDRFSRNNVLHLWPFVIEDLRMLGAKKFFGKFCAGAIDHISIRQLQCILLKVALILGIEVHTEVSFEKLIEPSATEKTGWRAEFKPTNHPVNLYEFDVIIGADGKRNTLQGFSRKEFRGKLAIAITANFINRKTEAEARVEEISGVAFIFNQKFFKELQEETRIDLENIVYYKDDTHYFVMTAKKASLLEKGVIKQDLADTEKLLAPDNVDREALEQYAIDAANFSTNYMLPNLEFAVNHYGQPDIAMFDFTSMYAAENASKVVERNGYKLLMILVGDSLLEPFWPTGSGCARGFLSSLDAAWAIRSWSTGAGTPLDVLAERESIYRLLAQTTPDNLNKDWKSYTVDPATRYPNLNRTAVLTHQIVGLYDTDNTANIEKMKRNSYEKPIEVPRKRRRGNVDNDILLTWLKDQLKEEQDIEITDVEKIFKGGKVLCAIIHHYRPDLLDYQSVKEDDPAKNNQLAFDVLEKELGIPPVMTGEEITNTEDYLTMATYLTEVYDTFRGEIPHIKHPKLNPSSKIPKLIPSKPVSSLGFRESDRQSREYKETVTQTIKIEHNKIAEKLSGCVGSHNLLDDVKKNYNTPSRTKNTDLFVICTNTFSIEPKNQSSSSTKFLKKYKSHNEVKKVTDYVVPDDFQIKKRKVKSSASTHLKKFKNHSKTVLKEFSLMPFEDFKDDTSKYPVVTDQCVISKNNENTDSCFKIKRLQKRKSVTNKLSNIPSKESRTKLNNRKKVILKKITDNIDVLDQKLNSHTDKMTMESSSPYIEVTKSTPRKATIKIKSPTLFTKPAQSSTNKKLKISNNLKIDNEALNTEIGTENKGKHFQQQKLKEVDQCLQSVQKVENKRIKNFITKLLLKKKKSVMGNLSVISEGTETINKEKKLVLEKVKKYEEHIIQKLPQPQVINNDFNIYNVHTLVNNESIPLPICPRNLQHTSDLVDPEAQSSDTLIKIRLIERKPRNKFTIQKIEFVSSLNTLTISSKINILKQLGKIPSMHGDSKKIPSFSSKLLKPFLKPPTEYIKNFQGNNYTNKIENRKLESKNFGYHSKMLLKKNDITKKIPVPLDVIEKLSNRHNIGQRKDLNCCQQHVNKVGKHNKRKLQPNCQCHRHFKNGKKFLSKKMTMVEEEKSSDQVYCRVSDWLSSHDFLAESSNKADTDIDNSLIQENSKNEESNSENQYAEVVVEERTNVVDFNNCNSPVTSEDDFMEMIKNISSFKNRPVRTLSKLSRYSPLKSVGSLKSTSAPPTQFSVIVEGEETDLPESNKYSDFSFKTAKTVNIPSAFTTQQSRPSSRHKRHIDMTQIKPSNADMKKTRKRRTLERIGASVAERQKTLEEIASNRAERQNRRRQQRKLQTEQFLKSMQMLQANAKSDNSQPFEDYSIFLYRQTAPKFEDRVKDLEKQFTYIPDHDNKSAVTATRTVGADEDLAARIKNLEQKWNEPQPVEKKPKDLLRAIGKIETSDWNIKEIEKKIMENKMGKPNKTFDKEKVPKWSKEQFLARQTKMEKQHLERQDSSEAKFADIDKSIKKLDQKLKEGTVRQLGTKKVATITEKLVNKVPPEPKPPEKTTIRNPVVLPAPNVSEFCHFCQKRVYLMERLSAEGRFFHHSCFKCQYCQSQLRLGSYAFDRDGLYGFKFFCLHHFGMVSEIQQPTASVVKKPSLKLIIDQRKSPDKRPLPGIAGVDLLDRVQTPERVEFANLSSGHISSDHEDPLSQMDEDEWTDKNFGASCAELADSDDESSSLSDSDSDDEDMFDDALEEPVTKEGTMKWAERWKNSYSKKRHNSNSDGYSSSDRSSYYDSSEDDESDTATEGEEEIRARELRKQEVRVEPPVVQTDTGTDTEIVSDESSSDSSSEVHNSATEISTDSEFAQDDPTPTRELPHAFNDFNVTKTRGTGRNYPKKIQVTSGFLQKPVNEKAKTKQSKQNIELKLKPLVPLTPIKKPAPLLLPRTEGYSLNRTQSTGGIAAKVSLELKKKYLLGEPAAGSIQKSGSASTLDTKFKTFQTTISDCQKLLKPAPEISASMQTFVTKLDERKSPILSPQTSVIFGKDINNEVSPKDKEQISPNTVTEETEQVLEPVIPEVFQNESEGRPRSPVHETSIIVPQIDWSKNHQSLSSDSLASSDSENNQNKLKHFENIPRVEVHEAKYEEKEENLMDSLSDPPLVDNRSSSVHSEAPKSITTEKKSLNQPKTLPSLETMLPEIHNSLHIKFNKPDTKPSKEISEVEVKSQKNSSGLSSPDSVAEQITTALTETELSDWARDEIVSDDFEDVAYDTSRKYGAKIANMSEFDDMSKNLENKHSFSELKNKTVITEAMNNLLSANLDNIEFMDTGTETSSDDGIPDSQNGYVLFKNEDEFAEDSLNPNINEIFEAKNVHVNEKQTKNTGYCIIADDIAEESPNLNKPVEAEKSNKNLPTVNNEHEEDSLMVLETTGTTTEENTFSDSTVKNITEISVDKLIPQEKPLPSENNNKLKQRLEEKLAAIKAEAKLKEQASFDKKKEDNIEFEEHCKRLQSKVEFGNVRDSIDIRKSRRKSKSDSPQKPDLIQEEKIENKDITLSLSPTPHTPDILYNKEVIKKERDINQKLIQEMVMNKMRAENKSLERKKRTRPAVSPSSPFALSKSATTDIVSEINLNNLDKSNRKSTYSTSSSNYSTPDVLLSTNIIPLQNSMSMNVVSETPSSSVPKTNRPLNLYSLPDKKVSEDTKHTPLRDNKNATSSEEQFTPKAPPRQNRLNSEDINRKLEKLKQTAKLKNKENAKVEENTNTIFMNAERMNSCLYSNDTLNKKRNNSFRRSKSGDSETQTSKSKLSLSSTNLQQNNVPVRTKSISEIPKSDLTIKQIDLVAEREKMCKSDPNILETDKAKPKKKSKDRERRKSITKLITTLFTKKSPGSNSSKGLFSKLSPKSKEISKPLVKEPVRRSSFSEVSSTRNILTPPPVPPLPLNYRVKGTDESSEGEEESRKEHSSCDTLDKLGTLEFSTSSNTQRRSSKAHRAARQAQLKRHRMAQEIQRKLEETEVKTKELESRGVLVEKALRGEDDGKYSKKDECELLQEWFDLMRDRTELRRYERELMVRAQELELEDRHARLQHELRDRLENNEPKTEKELKIEEDIINEMMAIVAERDSLIAVIEEDRLRYSNEDRDLEEQMLAKGLRLTPIKKSPEK